VAPRLPYLITLITLINLINLPTHAIPHRPHPVKVALQISLASGVYAVNGKAAVNRCFSRLGLHDLAKDDMQFYVRGASAYASPKAGNHELFPALALVGPLTLTLAGAGLAFSPSSVSISAGDAVSASASVTALADTPAGTVDVTVGVVTGVDNNNRLSASNFVLTAAASVAQLVISSVSVLPPRDGK
jgi:hypothetical protein